MVIINIYSISTVYKIWKPNKGGVEWSQHLHNDANLRRNEGTSTEVKKKHWKKSYLYPVIMT
jgi:hypothetical protein